MSVQAAPQWAVRWPKVSKPSRTAWTIAAATLALAGAAALVELARANGVSATALPPPGEVPAEARDWLLALVCAPLGARIAAHAPRNVSGWLVLAVALMGAGTVASAAVSTPPTDWLRLWLWWPSYGLLVLVALLFPTGRPASPRWRPVVRTLAGALLVGVVGLISLASRAPGLLAGDRVVAPGWDTVAVLGATAALLIGTALAVASLVIRIVRASAPTRGPLLWAGVNSALLLGATVLDTIEGAPLIWLLGALAMPMAAVIGVLRYGLYEIDMLIHRSLQYGLLSAAVLAVYPVAVLLAARVMPPAAAAAVAVVVVALLPLRDYVRSLLRLGMYGLGARPHELVDLLNRRVGAAQLPEEVLATAVAAIGEGMKVPFVQVRLAGRPEPEATAGHQRPWSTTALPLTYQGQVIGELVVQQRSPDEAWSRREQRLLLGLVAQLGPSAASVRLTRELRAARERLVRTREEELRRLQRDLHDGVGPALSGARMLTAAARRHAGEPAVQQLLERVTQDLADASGELRHIVDGLRPPALDRGLQPALEAAVRRHQVPGLRVDLHVDSDLTDLPAAVEVAAYRLVDEALTNVVKHAQARHADVTVNRLPDRLGIEVTDDGTGPGSARAGGVGLDSMRQRCEELGGDCRVVAAEPGTRVRAELPIIEV